MDASQPITRTLTGFQVAFVFLFSSFGSLVTCNLVVMTTRVDSQSGHCVIPSTAYSWEGGSGTGRAFKRGRGKERRFEPWYGMSPEELIHVLRKHIEGNLGWVSSVQASPPLTPPSYL